jgi:hypothetical protein
MPSFDTYQFVSEFLAYLQSSLNTIITANNTDYNDTLLTAISDYVYIGDDYFDQLRCSQCVVYDTPQIISIDQRGSKAMTTESWRLGIAFAENGRDMNFANLAKVLRYKVCLQKAIEGYFKKNGFCTPEMVSSIIQSEKTTSNNIYRFIIFEVNFSIAGT